MGKDFLTNQKKILQVQVLLSQKMDILLLHRHINNAKEIEVVLNDKRTYNAKILSNSKIEKIPTQYIY